MKRETISNLCLFSLLVLLAVAGRWIGASDRWDALPPNFTPVAAVGLFAGFVFGSGTLALLVPLVALAISNLLLDSYGSLAMGATVYCSFLAAPLLGRWLRRRPSLAHGCVCVLLPAVLFFLTTNLAHWLVDAQHVHRMYAAGCSGLLACYAAGVPFFRWMLEGDVLFAALLFGVYGLSSAIERRRHLVPAFARKR